MSGDHPGTVASLVRQIGVEAASYGQIVSGAELEQMADEGIADVARKATVFGRVTPQQKARLIDALRSSGRYVAMIGDGVNDVPALKRANVALAMRSGSEVTRGMADVILVDDAFTVLPGAFQEGQRIRDGMKASMELFLNRTFYTMLIIFFTALGGTVFPVALRHGALVAAITVGIPAFALALWARPGMTDKRLLPPVFETVVPAAITVAAVGLAVYRFFLTLTGDVVEAQTALTATTMLCGLVYVVFLRPPSVAWSGAAEATGDRRPFWLAGALLAAYGVIALVPPLKELFDLRTLPLSGYVIIIFVTVGWATSLRLIWRLKVARKVYFAMRSAVTGLDGMLVKIRLKRAPAADSIP
jgi:cation-transporting ATPase E